MKRSASARLAAADQSEVMEAEAYPNPSAGIFTFTIVNSGEGQATGKIYTAEDSHVAKVFERDAVDGEKVEFSWNPEGMKPGVYYIRFQSGSTVKMKRIVLKDKRRVRKRARANCEEHFSRSLYLSTSINSSIRLSSLSSEATCRIASNIFLVSSVLPAAFRHNALSKYISFKLSL